MPRRTKSKPRQLISPRLAGYWELSQQPLQALFFLVPFIVLYEIGAVMYAHNIDITARLMLRSFFEWFGVAGYYLPGLVVVVVLISWHFARKDPIRLEPKTYLFMAAESIAWALPLFVFFLLLARQPEQAAGVPIDLQSSTGEPTWQARMVFSFGAGIYEELLFRLIAIALLHLLLVDVLGMAENWGAGGAIALSAVAFAFYHFTGGRAFEWGPFLQYTLAGVYFAGIYLFRGFGIVAGTHAFYDVMAVALMLRAG